MSNRNKCLLALYRRFLADQSFYERCYARSMAEAAHHAQKRALPADSIKPATNEVE